MYINHLHLSFPFDTFPFCPSFREFPHSGFPVLPRALQFCCALPSVRSSFNFFFYYTWFLFFNVSLLLFHFLLLLDNLVGYFNFSDFNDISASGGIYDPVFGFVRLLAAFV